MTRCCDCRTAEADVTFTVIPEPAWPMCGPCALDLSREWRAFWDDPRPVYVTERV